VLGICSVGLFTRLGQSHSFIGKIESGERRLDGDGIMFVVVAEAVKVDPIELFTRFVRSC